MAPTTRPCPGSGLIARRVHARGPRVWSEHSSRRAILVCMESCATGRAENYLVATAVERPGRPTAYVLCQGFMAADESLAWRSFSDRVNAMALDLEARAGPPALTLWRKPS